MSVPRQGRGKRVWLIAAIVVIVAAFAAAIVWRGALTGTAAEAFLQRQFKLNAQVAVTDIDTTGVSFSTIRLGRHNEAQFKDVRVDYVTNGFAAPVIQHVDVGEANVHFGYDGELRLGDLERLIAVIRESDSSGGPLPIVIIHRLTVVLDTPIGTQRIVGMATYDKDTLFTNLNWAEPNNAAQFGTTATIRNFSAKMQPEGQFQATITPQSRLWQLFPSIPPKAGLISLEMALAAGNNDMPTPRLQVNLSAQGIALPQLAAPIDLHIATTLQAARDNVVTSEITPKRIVFRDLAVDLKGGPSPSFTGTVSNGNGTIDLSEPDPHVIADIGIDLRDQAFPLGTVVLKEPTVGLKLHVAYDGDNLTITPTDIGKVTLLDISGAPVTLPSLLTLPIQADGSQFTWSSSRDSDDQMALSLALGDVKAQVLPVNQKTPIALVASAPKLSLGGSPTGTLHGKLTLPSMKLTRQALLVLMANIQTDFSAAPAQGTGSANLAISDVELPNIVVPLHLNGKMVMKDGKVDFGTSIMEPKSKNNMVLNGTYDLTKHQGRAHVELAPTTFAANGSQPADMVPAAGNWIRNVSGNLGLKGDVMLSVDGNLTSDLDLALGNVSGKVGPAVFQNLNAVIKIDRPWPFSTAPGQSVAIEQAVLGLPFTNGLVHFDVDDGKTVKIDSGTLTLANGQVSLDPTTLSLDAPVQQLNLKVEHLAVNELFKLINIAGLSGEGDIAGNIPVSLFPDGILIKDAKLAATGPGTLKYDVANAPAAVKNADSNVKMALSALSDFHYKELSMTLQRQLTGDAALGLHISGSNPSFYNGYPVEFNFTASGRLDEILRQGLAGYEVPDMIEKRLNQFQ